MPIDPVMPQSAFVQRCRRAGVGEQAPLDAGVAGIVHPAHGVLVPVGVVALREVLARVRAARFGAVLGADNRGQGLAQQVLQLSFSIRFA